MRHSVQISWSRTRGATETPVSTISRIAAAGKSFFRLTKTACSRFYRALSRWRIAASGWSGISFYSSDLALYFFRSFLIISPHFASRELIYWTRCCIYLSRIDFEIAKEFLTSGSKVLLKTLPRTRSAALTFIKDYSLKQSSKSVRKGLETAVSIAASTTDDKVTARVLELAAKITRKSYFGGEIIILLHEILCKIDQNSLFQKTVFLHILSVCKLFDGKSSIEFLSAVSTALIGIGSDDESALFALLYESLLDETKTFAETNQTGSLAFFQSGLEFTQLGKLAVINEWQRLCKKFQKEGNWAFNDFAKSSVESTKMLVTLASERSDSETLVLSVFEVTAAVCRRNIKAAINLYTATPPLLGRMTVPAYIQWAKQGLDSLSDNEKLIAYFSAESRLSQKAIAETDTSLKLESVSHVLSNYVRMLTGKDLPIVAARQKYDVVEPLKTDEIGLPPKIDRHGNKKTQFLQYKVIAAQRIGQLEFGTFEKGTESLLGLADRILTKYPRFPRPKLNGNTDWYILVHLFPLTTLSERLFLVLENARIEYLLSQNYRGLIRDLAVVRADRKNYRPPDQYLIKYETLLEELFIEALGTRNMREGNHDQTSSPWAEKVRKVLANYIYKDDSNLSDTISSVFELYEFLGPEDPETSMPWEDRRSRAQSDDNKSRSSEQDEKNVRSDRKEKAASSNVEEAAAFSHTVTSGTIDGTRIFASGGDAANDASSLEERHEPNTFLYDEWDERISDYRPDWCRVIERRWNSTDFSFPRKTRTEYKDILSQIRSQFQMLRPSGLTQMRGQVDGEELDLDAITDFVADKRSHRTPSDRIYAQRLRRERDVAVSFLLDMSVSTHTRISGSKRVLDIEKESLLLMSEALNAIGDTYSIFGFSSQGRKRVSFYRFKDFDEPYTEDVEKRIGAATWLVNTRMGAAIRHATWHLKQQPHQTRLLIILSDGQPADEEYGWQNASADTRKSLQEARNAGITPFFITFNQGNHLSETELMLDGFGFAVIEDVISLPEKMPRIYRKLTS